MSSTYKKVIQIGNKLYFYSNNGSQILKVSPLENNKEETISSPSDFESLSEKSNEYNIIYNSKTQTEKFLENEQEIYGSVKFVDGQYVLSTTYSNYIFKCAVYKNGVLFKNNISLRNADYIYKIDDSGMYLRTLYESSFYDFEANQLEYFETNIDSRYEYEILVDKNEVLFIDESYAFIDDGKYNSHTSENEHTLYLLFANPDKEPLKMERDYYNYIRTFESKDYLIIVSVTPQDGWQHDGTFEGPYAGTPPIVYVIKK